MTPYLPFVGFAIFIVIVIVVAVTKGRAGRAARAGRLSNLGFSPCPEDASLSERIRWLENNAGFKYWVKDPMKLTLDGREVYYYEKSCRRGDDIHVAEEFLVPLKRPSEQGVMLFVKPSNIPAGTGTRLLGSLVTGAWDSQPDDLAKIEIPTDLQGTNLVGAMGPPGASLYELMDATMLNLMMQVGDFGILVVLCRGEFCSLGNISARTPLDLEKACSFIRDLLG